MWGGGDCTLRPAEVEGRAMLSVLDEAEVLLHLLRPEHEARSFIFFTHFTEGRGLGKISIVRLILNKILKICFFTLPNDLMTF